MAVVFGAHENSVPVQYVSSLKIVRPIKEFVARA
jgi:hypothetical protein